jgi:hypothetical protein
MAEITHFCHHAVLIMELYIWSIPILNISKPAGPDNLPPKFLKAVFQSLVKPLTILFQKSLNFGVVPGDWKLANVSPNLP